MQGQAAPRQQDELNRGEIGDLRILVVDDEETIRETLQMYFRHLGAARTDAVHDGPSALERLENSSYDYMFLDLMLPGMSGMDVLRELRERQIVINVIIMTGYPSMEVAVEAMHNGASDFLIKPFGFQDIKITLNRIQRVRHLMKRNWELQQELDKKREVEELNRRLQRYIKHQTLLYNIIDSLSKISRSEDLYQYMIQKAVESSGASKACFLFYDPSTDSLMALAQQGLPGIRPGTVTGLVRDESGRPVLDPAFLERHFHSENGRPVHLESESDLGRMVGVPFKIRNEPFGILLVADKKEDARGFDSEDRFILNFLAEKTALNVENMALYDNLKQSFIATLLSLVGALEAKDAYTQQHSKRVTEYSLRIAEHMGCSQEEMEKLESTGPLHDVGKIGIKDNVLNKPGPLTDDEFDMIRAHPLIGVNIVSPLGLAEEELGIVRNHHERWDGNGYPDGLKREGIPFLARILAVADAFDAMSSDRAYRSALPASLCLEELRRNSGSQFDPEVVTAALRVFS